MDPRKQNGHRGYIDRELKRKKARKLAASQWQHEVFTPKEGKKMNAGLNETRSGMSSGIKLLITLFALLILSICILVFVWNPFGIQITRSLTTPPPAGVDKNSVSLLPTPVVEPTEIPVVPTEIPVIEPTQVPMLVAVICDTPFIDASLDNGQTWESKGLFLDTNLGKRMTFTSRSLLVPEKEWNVELTSTELKTVEETWQKISVCVPEGLTAVIFTGGFEQGVDRYETGALLSLQPGLYEFNMRNGEVVIWYPEQEKYVQDDLDRIIQQIRVGNFDIKSPLAFFAATADLFAKVPQDLVKERNVQIAPPVDPVVK